jgi:tellurite resistance protein TerC
VTAAGWAVTVAVIVALLLIDYLALGRRPRPVRFVDAAWWSVGYIAVAVAFGVVFALVAGWDLGTQYLTGYVVEKALSLDNLFVFVVIMAAFAVPAEQQPKALTIGITLALVLRTVFIALGAALLDTFSFMFLIFGAALVVTAVQLFRHRNLDPTLDENVLVGLARRLLPVSDRYDGGHLVTRMAGGPALTPLFLVLVAIGTSDLMFAFDSIPAVFGVTDHAYVVFAATAFSLLGLRPLYFLVSGLLDRLVYLSTGLPVILGFIGIKLVLEFAHDQDQSIPTISIGVSLAVIATVIGATTVASLIKVRRRPWLRAHTGALRNPSRARDPEGSPTEEDA